MSDNHEWSEWFEHDGKGCPVPLGTYVHAVGVYRTDGKIAKKGEEVHTTGFARHVGRGWDWSLGIANGKDHGRVLRYRIRKPRALTQLQDLIADLPAPVTREEVEG